MDEHEDSINVGGAMVLFEPSSSFQWVTYSALWKVGRQIASHCLATLGVEVWIGKKMCTSTRSWPTIE